jgi:hypothetical protein
MAVSDILWLMEHCTSKGGVLAVRAMGSSNFFVRALIEVGFDSNRKMSRPPQECGLCGMIVFKWGLCDCERKNTTSPSSSHTNVPAIKPEIFTNGRHLEITERTTPSFCSRCGTVVLYTDDLIRDYCDACLDIHSGTESKQKCKMCINTARRGRFLCRPCNTKEVRWLKWHTPLTF